MAEPLPPLKPHAVWGANLEEHNEHVRELWSRWGYPGEPAPCDCGFYAPSEALSLCRPAERARCRETAQERLRKRAREDREREVRDRRKFPGVPFPRPAPGHCQWCDGEIYTDETRGRLNLRRRWHPECLHQYFLHTRREDQLPFLVRRDGPACRRCGRMDGRWLGRAPVYPSTLRGYGIAWVRRYPEETFVGQFSRVEWCSSLEVDHVRALALVAHLEPEERRPFFGPPNLQLLCSDCHKTKTREDLKLITEARRSGLLP